jgi:hypothetical protein
VVIRASIRDNRQVVSNQIIEMRGAAISYALSNLLKSEYSFLIYEAKFLRGAFISDAFIC